MSTMAMSGRSVNCSKVASIVDTCVSGTQEEVSWV